jgi:5-oxoprolinase (ATP-hydrolysing) subunit C
VSLRVLEPGLCTLVVDFGRSHSRSLGVPIGGAADRASLALGNALVGNAPDAPGLEICLAGPTLQAETELACVLFGAPFDLERNGRSLPSGKTFTLSPGDELRIGSTLRGLRGYLCVRGGLQVPLILGSRSSLEPIRKNDTLPCQAGTIHGRFVIPQDKIPHLSPDGLAELFRSPSSGQPGAWPLRLLSGAQADWFDEQEFYRQEMQVTPASDRMGLRLEGRPLAMPNRELVSEPVCPGAVQVTRDGQCIILGVDGQTIGGYPKIAQVIQADLDHLAQLRPGDSVRFVKVELEEAADLFRRRQRELSVWIDRVRTALDGIR